MRLINLLGALSVHHPEHGAAAVGPDGVFTVPEPFGQALLTNRAHWATEDEHAAAQAAEQLADLADPRKTPSVLLELRKDRDEIRQRLDAIEEHLGFRVAAEPVPAAEPTAQAEEGGTQTPFVPGDAVTTDVESPAEPAMTRQQKAAATRAANKAAAAAADAAPAA